METKTSKAERLMKKLLSNGSGTAQFCNLFSDYDDNDNSKLANVKKYSRRVGDLPSYDRVYANEHIFRCYIVPSVLYNQFKKLVANKKWTQADMDLLLGQGGIVELLASAFGTSSSSNFKRKILPIAKEYQCSGKNISNCNDIAKKVEDYLCYRQRHTTIYEKLDASKRDRLKVLSALLAWDMFDKLSVNNPYTITINANIPYAHYAHNDSIRKVIIKDGVKTIGLQAFLECNRLNTVILPDSLTTIEDSAFRGCKALSNIEIPDGVTSIGGYAFDGCFSLTKMTIPGGIKKIESGLFESCCNLRTVNIPDRVKEIGGMAFYRCKHLVNVNIPSSVTSIGDYAFEDCESLKEINLPTSVDTIGRYAFGHCESLRAINIPTGVKTIGRSAFACCHHLKRAVIPPHITAIGDDVFWGCYALKEVTLTPDFKTSFSGAFKNCGLRRRSQIKGNVSKEVKDSIIKAAKSY